MESSSSVFDSSWGLLGGSWKGLGSSSEALGDALGLETVYSRKMKVSPRWEHDFGNESRKNVTIETMRPWDYEITRVGCETMGL